MEEPTNQKSLDTLIQEEELKRLKAEVGRLSAEREKIEIETGELRKEYSRKWFLKKRFLQTIVAGLVLIPALWFYFTELVFPLYRADNIKLTLENEIVRDSLKHVGEKLEGEIYALVLEKQQLAAEAARVDSQHRNLATEYRRLNAVLSRSESQRLGLERKADSLESLVANAQARRQLAPNTYRLKSGVYRSNTVIYNRDLPTPIESAFRSILPVLIVVGDDKGDKYIPDFGINTIRMLQPGRTYYVAVERDTVFAFPQ